MGIFTTKNTSAMNQKTVRITAYASSGTAVSVYDGAKVYIKSVANSNNLQVSICDATVTAGGSTQSSLKTQFIIPM
jgi:ActR/RegA family two-component response regulator